MTYVFWGLASTMMAVAMILIAMPLKNSNQYGNRKVASIALTVPFVSICLYAIVGAPDALTADVQNHPPKNSDAQETKRRSSSGSVASIGNLVDGLKARLEESPDDAGGWLLLAQSYRHLGRHDEAQLAYARAKKLGKSDPLFESSNHADVALTKETEPASGPALRGRVVLADELSEQVKPTDTIFIFAKESREHRMPVAAIRRPAEDLPINFELTNADAMIAGTDLKNFEQLVVTARVSRSGLATDGVEGLEVWSAPVSPTSDHAIELIITPSTGDRIE